jgi:hypothetical protein
MICEPVFARSADYFNLLKLAAWSLRLSVAEGLQMAHRRRLPRYARHSR